jgi:hypothetical protein
MSKEEYMEEYEESHTQPDYEIRVQLMNLLAHRRKKNERPHSMTIIDSVEEAIILSIARAYVDVSKKYKHENGNEPIYTLFMEHFLDYLEEYSLAIKGSARKDIKEVWTKREYSYYSERPEAEEEGEGGEMEWA